MGLKASYIVIRIDSESVTLKDLDRGKSVTNDAERVVEEVLALYGPKRIFYYDTLGNHDELCHDRARFTHFAPARDLAP